MSLPVFTTPVAEEQIRKIHQWWVSNRPAAPDLFADELAYCIELLAETPGMGKAYRQHPVRGLRRILLRATRYHVYYTVRSEGVLVLAVWHSMRSQQPPL